MSHQKTNTTNNTKHNKQSHKRHMVSLVFKWGSLVGLSLPSTSGLNGTTPFVAGDVVFRPDGFTGRITNDWATVPYCTTDFAPYGNPTADHLSQVHNPANIARGIGDICRYMGVIDSANWRMPTAVEFTELYGSDQMNQGKSTCYGDEAYWLDGNYLPLHGRTMGPNRNGVRIVSDTEVLNATPYRNGAVFLSATGYRLPTGEQISIGGSADYWTATGESLDNAYLMWHNFDHADSFSANIRTHAFTIRCIRE